jgi:hypothetical protein
MKANIDCDWMPLQIALNALEAKGIKVEVDPRLINGFNVEHPTVLNIPLKFSPQEPVLR